MSFHQSDSEKLSMIHQDDNHFQHQRRSNSNLELHNNHTNNHNHRRILHLNPQPFSTHFLEHTPRSLTSSPSSPSSSSSQSSTSKMKRLLFRLKNLIQWFMSPLVFRLSTTLISLVLFLLCSLSSLVLPLRRMTGLSNEQTQVIAITLFMISLWVFQSIPLAATSLIPVFAFPLLGVMSGAAVSKEYVNQVSMIFIGGFIFALSIERWRLHERIALFVLSRVGSRLSVVLVGSMSIAYVMSMWLSNTASCLILMPNCAAIIYRLKHQYATQYGASKEKQDAVFVGLELGLFMGIAFACNIGGIATPIGTPPNLLFAQQYEILFPGQQVPNFLQWIALAGPISFIFFLFLYAYLYWFYVRRTIRELKASEVSQEAPQNQDSSSATTETDNNKVTQRIRTDSMSETPSVHDDRSSVNTSFTVSVFGNGESPRPSVPFLTEQDESTADHEESDDEESESIESFQEQYSKLGRMSYEEWVVAVLFLILVVLWSTRFAWQKIPIFKKDYMNDGLVAVGLGFLLFIIPARNQNESLNSGEFVSIMDWSVMTKFPWDIILLFGAGFSISAAFSSTGLTTVIAKNLELIKHWHPIFLILVSCTVVTFCTEVITNIATIIVFLPILAAVAQSSGTYHPLLILIPATISSSYAFMLPIGTAPNMIAFKATSAITINRMMKAGIWLNFFAIALTTSMSYVLIPLIYGKNWK